MPERKLNVAEVHGIYDRCGPALVAFACALVADYALAEDIVHNVFLRALSGDLTLPESPVAYFYRAVRNAALNAKRDRRKDVPLPDSDSWLIHKGNDRVAALTLQRGLELLPAEQREVVILHQWSGLTFAEVAAVLEISPDTAASRYRYALEKLREHFRSTRKREEVRDAASR